MVPAREALLAVEQAVASARNDEAALDTALRSASDEAERLRTEIADAYRALAKVRLDDAARGEIVGALDAAERRAAEELRRRRKNLAEIAERRAAAQAEVAAIEVERHAAAGEVARARAAFDAAREAAIARLRETEEWRAQEKRVEAALAVAAEARDKAARAAADLQAKRQPYENDPLFLYLWNRHFGTAAYAGRGITRYLDSLVARVSGYDAARRNYALLQEIPARLAAHAERRKEIVAQEEAKLHGLEDAHADAAGEGASQRAVLDGAQEKLARIDARLASARAALAQVDRTHEAALEADGHSFDAAVADLAETLSRAELKVLRREALATPSPADEAIVRRIEEREADLKRVDKELAEMRAQARDLARKRNELERVRDEFPAKGYDDPLGSFGNGTIIADVLAGILRGVLTSRDLERVLRDGFRAPRRAGRRRDKAFPIPGPVGFPDGGGPSGSGDGFRTGGGF